MDPERAIFDTIMLDEAVKVAKEFAGRNNDTLITVTPDYAHPVSIIGTYDDDRPGQTPREKLGVYEQAKFSKFPHADGNPYPSTVDVPQRIGLIFGSHPDHCENAKPYLDGEYVPAVAGAEKGSSWPMKSTAICPARHGSPAISHSMRRRRCTPATTSC
jgi:alkaline phosphatase